MFRPVSSFPRTFPILTFLLKLEPYLFCRLQFSFFGFLPHIITLGPFITTNSLFPSPQENYFN